MRRWFARWFARWFTGAGWERCCGVLMVVALLCVLPGTLPILKPSGGGPMSGAGDGLFFGLWLFGLFGLVAGFLQQAKWRAMLLNAGLGWSIAALAYGLVMYHCPFNEMCERDSAGNDKILVWCLLLLALLHVYDRYRARLYPPLRLAVRGISLVMLAAWLCVLVLVATRLVR